MFWIIKSILTTIILLVLTISLFGNVHIETGKSFFYIAFVISIFVMFIFHLLFKYTMPRSYAKYKAWRDNAKSTAAMYARRIIVLPLLGYLLFFTFGLCYLNQYHVANPIENIKTQVINKRTVYHNTTHHYTDIYLFPGKILTLSNDKLYDTTNIGDKVIVKVQKGRLGEYFVLELKVQKNNYILPL